LREFVGEEEEEEEEEEEAVEMFWEVCATTDVEDGTISTIDDTSMIDELSDELVIIKDMSVGLDGSVSSDITIPPPLSSEPSSASACN